MLNKALRSLLTNRVSLLSLWVVLSQCCTGQHETSQGFTDLPFKINYDTTVDLLTVNEEPITREGMLLFAQINRPRVLRHFHRADGTDPEADFWDQEIEGASPRADLLRRTLVTSVEVKVRLLLAREFGIRGEVNFENVKRRWQVENLRRQEAVERGEELFGPVQYTLLEYVENDLRSIDIALMQRLEEKDLLKEADSIWERQPGESRLERMQRSYKAYLRGEVEKAIVRFNQESILSLDLVVGEPGT